MIRLFEFLLYGCAHKWETVAETRLHGSGGEAYPIGRVYYCKCSKCGRPKRFTLSA